MHEYELMYILHPRLAADEVKDAIERVSAQIGERGGEVLSAENWGRRRLSYPINHHFEGTYVLSTLQLPPEATTALESALRISEDVIRHLLIRGIIPYEGPPAHDDRARGARAAAGDSPEAVEEIAREAPDAGEPGGAGGEDEAVTAAPAEATDNDGETESEAEESRAAGDAGSTD